MSRLSKKNIQTVSVNFPDAHVILLNAPMGVFTSPQDLQGMFHQPPGFPFTEEGHAWQ